MSLSWRQKCVQHLAADPTAWIRLSELFADVERDIPIHLAMRRQSSKTKVEIGLNTARWRMFLTHVGPLIERRACNGLTLSFRTMRTDMVRLRSEKEPCLECGSGPRYLLAWPGKKGATRKYVCLNCIKPVEIDESGVIEWVTEQDLVIPHCIINLRPKRKRKPKGPSKTQLKKARLEAEVLAKIETLPKPEVSKPTLRKTSPKPDIKMFPPKPLPKPQAIPKPKSLPTGPASINCVEDIWQVFKEYANSIGIHLPPIDNQTQADRRLRWHMRKALEAGAADQFRRLTTDEKFELQELKYDHQRKLFTDIFIEQLGQTRAIPWVNDKTPNLTGLERSRWGDMLCTAYRYGAFTIVCFYTCKRLWVVTPELSALVTKLYPPPRIKTIKPRWLSKLGSWRVG
jgi:hypothetical protein